jgi:hypothetical protein
MSGVRKTHANVTLSPSLLEEKSQLLDGHNVRRPAAVGAVTDLVRMLARVSMFLNRTRPE